MRRCADSCPDLLVGVLVVLMVMAGCATVPTTGPLEHHARQEAGTNSGVRIDPLPPAAGASRLLVVEGFLHAMSVYQPDYAVAREYLTEAASGAWHPESGVQIYADGYPPTEYDQTVALPAPLSGRLDAAGRYSPPSGETGAGTVPVNFTLVKNEQGEWRISNPPDGLLVSRYVFTTGFLPANLHFEDATGTTLVPDPRFFAAGEQAMEAAVRAQLAGPSTWLAPAVRTPDTEGVGVLDVTLDDDGTLEILLGGTADRLTTEQRRILLAEFAYTMTGFDQVGAVRVEAGGQVWRDDSGQSVVRPGSFGRLSPSGVTPRALFVIRDGKLQRLVDATVWGDFVTVDAPVARPEELAVSADLARFAVTAGTRLQLAEVGAAKARTLRTGEGLLRPSFSRMDELWSPVASGLAGLQVFDGDQSLPVVVEPADQLPGLAGQPLVALGLSPDGTRVAVVQRRSGDTVVAVARVERAEGSVVLSGWRTIDLVATTGAAGRALDLGWVSATELLVLQATEAGTSSVVRVSEDGATATDIGPSEADDLTRLAVSPRQAVALGSNGGLYRFDSEFNWNLAITAVDAAAWSG